MMPETGGSSHLSLAVIVTGAEFALIPGSAHLTTVDALEAIADTVTRFLRAVERR